MQDTHRVDVYWNLHRRCWSVRYRGQVVLHKDALLLKDVTFVVQAAGREKVRRTKRKNVHAFARGTWVGTPPDCFSFAVNAHGVHYNPYRDETFVTGEMRIPVHSADTVFMRTKLVDDPRTLLPIGVPEVWAKGVR